ncbi:MAG TPA: hypothetical protein VMH49_07580 [Thermoplasmata archaeon]|nr:hypothetical protein [Thermoplasmata archaeon]
MGAPTASMRCPRCGTPLRAALAPAPSTQWFPCPHCRTPVPFLVPRDLPALYSWEVLPGLYPMVSVPRRPRWSWRRSVSVALVAAAVLAAVAAALLAEAGVTGSEPTHYVVSGIVYEHLANGHVARAVGASVVLSTDDNASVRRLVTGPNGSFTFAGVPDGGIELNVTAASFAPTVVYTFASRAYADPTRGLNVSLYPAPANTTYDVLTDFPDLASFLAYAGGAATLVGIAAVAASVGAYLVRRPEGTVAAVVGSAAVITVPAIVLLFSLDQAFPLVTAVGSLAGAFGAFAVVLAAADLANGTDRHPRPV